MKNKLSLSYLFVSHDLSVGALFPDRVLVMYLGKIVESAPTAELWADPKHPYTRALLAAVPDPSRRTSGSAHFRRSAKPALSALRCRFHTRCPLATDICRAEAPEHRLFGPAHAVACHHTN